MASKVIVLSGAREDFDRLPKREQGRIAPALRSLIYFPVEHSGIKKLRPPFEGFRKRVGNYRILFDFEDGTVVVRHIVNRKDAYR
jgi:mRNA-degrading endonuclease RelE of RelBE toxin-antitoxin system